MIDILLCGHPELKEYENQQLFEAVINFIVTTNRFK